MTNNNKTISTRGLLGKSMMLCPMAAAFMLMASACASPPAAVTAARVERLQCDPGSDEAHLAKLVRGASILGVEARYTPAPATKGSLEERIAGATILMRPPEGVSAEQMTRILQCHSARALLGQIGRPELAKDPFSLPNTWVNIAVTPQDGNYAVTLQTDSIADNARIAELAASFAQEHGAYVSAAGLE